MNVNTQSNSMSSVFSDNFHNFEKINFLQQNTDCQNCLPILLDLDQFCSVIHTTSLFRCQIPPQHVPPCSRALLCAEVKRILWTLVHQDMLANIIFLCFLKYVMWSTYLIHVWWAFKRQNCFIINSPVNATPWGIIQITVGKSTTTSKEHKNAK